MMKLRESMTGEERGSVPWTEAEATGIHEARTAAAVVAAALPEISYDHRPFLSDSLLSSCLSPRPIVGWHSQTFPSLMRREA